MVILLNTITGPGVSADQGDGLHRPEPVPGPRLLQRGQSERREGLVSDGLRQIYKLSSEIRE